jgi:hypothetical protein
MSNQSVKTWLQDVIIGFNLCPFAKDPFEKGLIRISECKESDEELMLKYFLTELDLLQKSTMQELSTSLLCFPNTKMDFPSFHDFSGLCETLLQELNLLDSFQLVTFHPDFQFANCTFYNRANLVNRSPMPLIHLIRREEIAMVMNDPSDGEKISFNNEDRLNQLDTKQLKEFFPYLTNIDKY